MFATEVLLADPVLYETTLGGIASICVTHNAGCIDTPYSANLALHVQDRPADVLQRRSGLEARLGKPIQWLNQVHGTAVLSCDEILQATPTADAAITQNPELAIAVMTADCLPVAFSASNLVGQSAVAVAHAGWRGLASGILRNTVQALHAAVPQASIHVHLGPCIGVAQFEVGPEVRAEFIVQHASNAAHFTVKSTGKADHKYLCDLDGIARDALLRLGVSSISGGGWCTVSDPRLASYRRNAITGRFATVVSLNAM